MTDHAERILSPEEIRAFARVAELLGVDHDTDEDQA